MRNGSSQGAEPRAASSSAARASAGGARASGGVGNQARVAAWLGSLILANQPTPWLVDTPLIAVGGETGLAVDDVAGLTDREGFILIQAKGRLQMSNRRTSEFAKAVDQVVCQFIYGVPTGNGSRPIDERRDRLVIAGDGRSSAAIKELAIVTGRLRALPAVMPIPSAAKNARQQRALATLVNHVRESWIASSLSHPSDEEIRNLLRVLAVDVLELEDGGADRATASAHLAAALIDAKNERLAWTGLTALGLKLSEQRAWRRRSDIAAELDAIGAPVCPGRRHAASVSKLRRVSEANLRSLAEHSGLPVDGEIIRCQRLAVDDLATQDGSFVIVGDPGCGKSGVVYELASRMASVEDILVLTAEGLPDSAALAQAELGLDADAYGRIRPEAILAARVPRAALDGVRWSKADALTILNEISSELVTRIAGPSKAFAPLDPKTEPNVARLIDDLMSRN